MSWSRSSSPDTAAERREVTYVDDDGPWRTVEVPAERLAGWIDRFEARHGPVGWVGETEAVRLCAPDGAVAVLTLPGPAPPAADRRSLTTAATSFDTFGVVLVRRGGFAVGRIEAAAVRASRCGTRYVQGKTKAGGWSQQRYARRRAHQADTVVQDAAEAVRTVLGDKPLPLVCGGDRSLVRETLSRAGRGGEAAVVRWLDVPEPRRQVLDAAVTQARAARIRLNESA